MLKKCTIQTTLVEHRSIRINILVFKLHNDFIETVDKPRLSGNHRVDILFAKPRKCHSFYILGFKTLNLGKIKNII